MIKPETPDEAKKRFCPMSLSGRLCDPTKDNEVYALCQGDECRAWYPLQDGKGLCGMVPTTAAYVVMGGIERIIESFALKNCETCLYELSHIGCDSCGHNFSGWRPCSPPESEKAVDNV